MHSHTTFAIDISGYPPESDTVIGLISLPLDTQSILIKKFKKKFSSYSRKKGWELERNELLRILSFLDKHISMVAVKCTRNNWNRRYSNLPKNLSFKKEKLYGTLYFIALKQLAKRNCDYDVVMCDDNFMKVKIAQRYSKRLSEYHKYIFRFDTSTGNLNPRIKIVDYVAAAGRKLKPNTLNELNNFNLIVTDIPYHFLRIFL